MSFFEELKRRNVFRVGIAYGVSAWFILQLADVVLENITAPDWVMQVIMMALAIGFPIVMIFSWAFEMTPDGIKKEKDVDRSDSVTRETGRKLDRVIIGVMAVVITFLVVDRLILNDDDSTAPQTTETATVAEEIGPSVAVLPFINMSGDQENEYFSDGLTETLLHMLAQLPDLRVAARTSSFAFKGKDTSIAEIASTLGVAHILEGSVQKSGERVRITAQLIRADDGFHVWSQNYTRPLTDIFAIQDEIAADVARALDTSLLGGTSHVMRGVETSNLGAYDSYLKGLEQQAIFSYGSLAIAENHFKQAIARDPDFIDARLALARNYLLKNSTGLIEDDETHRMMDPLIKRVRDQHPENRLARALEIQALIGATDVPLGQEELEPIITELRNLLPLIPTETTARQTVAATLYFFFKDTDAALGVLEAGLMIDPMAAELHRMRGHIYRDLDRLEDALTSYQQAQKLAPDNPNTYSSLGGIEEENNNLVAALNWHRRATEVDPQDHELAATIANNLYKLKLPEEGDRWYARVTALAPGSPVARHVEIHRYIARQDYEKAIELTRSMISEQIEDRRGAFFEAVFTYIWLMMESNQSQQAYEFLVSVRSEITDYAILPSDFNGMMMQFGSIGLMSGFESREVQKDAWLKLAANLDKTGFPWRDVDDFNMVWDLFIKGDVEAATLSYLEHGLNEPMATDLEMHNPKAKLIFPELFADPRVVTRLAELGKEHERLRQQVQELLLEPEWNQ